MLPIKLKMQAFASYAGAVEIDFEKLDSLFLIHGETGSGKTAILDGMMYALYGKSSGGERSAFRCALPEAEGVPTEVEFTFRSGGRLYRFVRSIILTPRSKELKSRQDCFVFDEEQGIFRALTENPTQTKVDREAERITGLTADQFRQVVILPQGQFERLLTSNSEDKEKTLSTLFAAEKYTEISRKLSEKSDELKRQLAQEETERKAMLAAENADSIEQLRQECSRMAEEKSVLTPMVEEAKNALSVLSEKQTAAEVLAGKFTALADAKKRLSALEGMTAEIEAVQGMLKRHAKAGTIRAEYADMQNRSEALKRRKIQFSSAEHAQAQAVSDYAAVTAEGEKLAHGEARCKEALEELAVLRQLAPVYEKISAAESRRRAIDLQHAEAEKGCAGMKRNLEKTEGEISRLEGERSDIQGKYAAALPALSARKAALENGAEADGKLMTYVAAVGEIQRKTGMLKSRLSALRQEKIAAEGEYDRLYGMFLHSTAAELSSALKDGMPCPVCGSREHPMPTEKGEGTVTSEQVREARTAFERAAKACLDKEGEVQTQEARIPAAQEHIEAMRKIVEDCGYTQAELAAVREQVRMAEEKCGLLPKIEERLAGLHAQKNQLSADSETCRNRLGELKNGLAAADAEIETLRGQLDSRYGSAAQYSAGIRRLTEETAAFEGARHAYEEKLRQAERRKTETLAAKNQAAEELAAAERAQAEACVKFAERLSEAGFADEEEFLGAVLSEKSAAEYSARAERYTLERHAAAEQSTKLAEELEGAEAPDLEKIRAEAESAAERYAEISAKNALVCERHARLERVLEEYTERFTGGEKRREQCDKLAAFARFMHGGKGISFTRYMLGIMLGLVVSEANRVLADIHGGRFRLCIKTDLAANSKQGLDLEVENITAEASMRYGVKNLSGGEKFLISLALSLGLSSVARSRSGGVEIEAMFIDEGFGSLDPTSLREAISILCGLTSRRNTIGIISHVEELKNVIPCSVSVVKDSSGCSRVC